MRWLRRTPRQDAGPPDNALERISAQSRPRPKLRTVLWEKGGSFSRTREHRARWALKVDEVGILRRVRLAGAKSKGKSQMAKVKKAEVAA